MIYVFCLAAGSARRFGSNKLMAGLAGKPVCAHVFELLQKLPDGCSVRVVTRYPEVAGLAAAYGLRTIDSPLSSLGASYTVKAALNSLNRIEAEDYLMFVLADQPYLRERTVRNMLAAAERGCFAASAAFCGVPGSPTLFSSGLVPELLALEGDRGGRAVLKRHPEQVVFIEAEAAEELMDIDRPEDLDRLN